MGYKVYIEPYPKQVTYDSLSYYVGDTTEVYLHEIEDFISFVDGSYNLGVTAIDNVGNESDISVLDNVVLDFIIPDPPGELLLMSSSNDIRWHP